MSQTHVIQFRLGPLETAMLDFYGETYGKTRAETVRTMIMAYVSKDRSFDAEAFQRYVTRKAAKAVDDPDERRVLVNTVKDYVASRRHAPATGKASGKRTRKGR